MKIFNYRIDYGWNKKKEREFFYIPPTMYDCEVAWGLVLWFFSISFTREATGKDFE